MALKPEIEAAFIIVAGIWASDLKDVPKARRKAAINRWIERHAAIYEHLKAKYESAPADMRLF